MSIFGNQTTSTTAPQGGLFGASNNQQQPQQQQPSGGIFGSLATPQNQQSTSIFGNPAPNTNTGGTGLFGGQNATSNTNQGTGGGSLFGGQQQQQPAAGSSLFGANTQQPQAAGGGLFGASNQQQQQPATGGGLFGGGTQQQQQPATTGIFGSNTNTQQPQQQQSGSIFGGNTQQSGGSTFGNKPGGLFGGLNINTNTTNTTPSPNTTTNTNPLFGGSLGQPQQQQQQQQTGGIFGQSTQNQQPQGGGIFGQSTQNQQPQGGGLFGQSTQTQQPQGGGLFGQSTQNQQPQTGGLFGQPTQNQQQRPSLFGNLGQSTTSPNPLLGGGNNNTLNTSALGTSTLGTGGLGSSTLTSNSLLSTRGPAGSAQQQGDAQAQSTKLIQRIEAIYAAWSPDSPQCRFQHTFYNLVNPNQVSLYRQPPNIPNDVWEKATRDNPDPTCFVPVMAFGFDNLRERVEAQSKQAEEHKARLKDLKASLETLSQRHAVSNAPRLQRAAAQQTQLTQRLLAFIQHLHLLIPAIRSSSIRPEEERLRGKLEEIEEDVRRGRMKGKLNELWALIGAVKAAQERGRVGGGGGGGEWAVVDDEGLAQIAQILSEQQAGLAHLTKILQKALKDLSVIMGNGASGSRGEDSYANDGDSLWSSTNTLRASSFR